MKGLPQNFPAAEAGLDTQGAKAVPQCTAGILPSQGVARGDQPEGVAADREEKGISHCHKAERPTWAAAEELVARRLSRSWLPGQYAQRIAFPKQMALVRCAVAPPA